MKENLFPHRVTKTESSIVFHCERVFWSHRYETNSEYMKSKHPWHLKIDVLFNFDPNKPNKLKSELTSQENIESILTFGLLQSSKAIKVISIIEDGHVQHHWHLSNSLPEFKGLSIFEKVRKIRPVSFKIEKDENWLAVKRIVDNVVYRF